MPLIRCPDCGNDVSTRATTCPKCGAPVAALGATLGSVPSPQPKHEFEWDDDPSSPAVLPRVAREEKSVLDQYFPIFLALFLVAVVTVGLIINNLSTDIVDY